VQLPVGQREPSANGTRSRTPEAIDGTSFSAPYVAGTVALMLQANPSLRTSDIQHLLQSTAKNIRGERDGAGVVDPVAAVRAARDFRVQ
jgi:serine protease